MTSGSFSDQLHILKSHRLPEGQGKYLASSEYARGNSRHFLCLFVIEVVVLSHASQKLENFLSLKVHMRKHKIFCVSLK